MILRRFMKHVDEQNWFAVGLDVIVVVVGIFLGMQVTDWNEERKEQEAEEVYLNLILRDIESVITEYREQEQHENLMIQSSRQAGKMLRSGINDGEQRVLARLITIAAHRRTMRIEKVAFNDLQSSGKLGIINHSLTRESIIRFFEKADRRAVIMEKNSNFGADQGLWAFAASSGIDYQGWEPDMDPALRMLHETDSLVAIASGLDEDMASPADNPLYSETADVGFWRELRSQIHWRARMSVANRSYAQEMIGEAEELISRIKQYQKQIQ